jgi:hypothetical protein
VAHPDTGALLVLMSSYIYMHCDGILSIRETLLVRLSVGTIAQSAPQTASNWSRDSVVGIATG